MCDYKELHRLIIEHSASDEDTQMLIACIDEHLKGLRPLSELPMKAQIIVEQWEIECKEESMEQYHVCGRPGTVEDKSCCDDCVSYYAEVADRERKKEAGGSKKEEKNA